MHSRASTKRHASKKTTLKASSTTDTTTSTTATQLALFFGATLAYAIVAGLLITSLEGGSLSILLAVIVYIVLTVVVITFVGNTGNHQRQEEVIADKNILQDILPLSSEIVDGEVRCTSGDYDDYKWDAGYKPDDSATPYASFLDREKYLQKVALDATRHIESTEVLGTLDLDDDSRTQQQQYDCCPMSTDWQGTFKGMPTTFIAAPGEPNKYKVTKDNTNENSDGCVGEGGDGCLLAPDKWQEKDKRLWFRSLDDEIYRRSRQNAKMWDPYKHHYARQMYAQFISSNMVNRKSFYERPIEHLEEASCFQKKINSS